MKKFIPIAQKKEMRGQNASGSSPALIPVRTYSIPSASVYPSSRSAVAPASCMWYPEIEMLLNFGILSLV